MEKKAFVSPYAERLPYVPEDLIFTSGDGKDSEYIFTEEETQKTVEVDFSDLLGQ